MLDLRIQFVKAVLAHSQRRCAALTVKLHRENATVAYWKRAGLRLEKALTRKHALQLKLELLLKQAQAARTETVQE
jgi:hypothetical protein